MKRAAFVFSFCSHMLGRYDCGAVTLSGAAQAYVPEFEVGGSVPSCCCAVKGPRGEGQLLG